ncbi:MAG: hypothetical protein KDJ65_08770 [Anaerolineae bacterium]|nr:hypothetical protein [Anaerolineae bacterium]
MSTLDLINLTKEQEKELYGYSSLDGIPEAMHPFQIGHVEHPLINSRNPGQYVLVDVEPADIEQHHQVYVIDEHGDPLPGVWVIFGFGSGKNLNALKPKEMLWTNGPGDLHGNAQRTNRMGYAQHTFGPETGETVWLWDVRDGRLDLPSVIVHSLKWLDAGFAGLFVHTGVKLTFQRRRKDVEPRGRRFDRIDQAIEKLQAEIETLKSSGSGDLAAKVEALANELDEIKLDVKFVKKQVLNT